MATFAKKKFVKIVLITPPFTQLNTPYPATAYIKGFLNTIDIESFQADLGIEVILDIFSKQGLTDIFEIAEKSQSENLSNFERMLSLKDSYIERIEVVIAFLLHKNPTLAVSISQRTFLPEGQRFQQIDDLELAFGNMGIQDKARHLATLYLEDLADFITNCVDENFGFSRYAEKLGRSANSFDELYNALQQPPTFIDGLLFKRLEKLVTEQNIDLLLVSVPFPGNLYAAFRSAQFVKQNFPNVKISMGGGFPNTELRSLSDNRVFDFFDFITLDDGEAPILNLIEHLQGKREIENLKRTFTSINNLVVYCNNSETADFKQNAIGTPDYSDLLLNEYISVIEIANPMHRMWSDGRWNKLTMAHGCYWGKCTFCDISLDYIKIYEPVAANILADRVQELIIQTGQTGFHFVDEAAPPALMRAFAIEILRRKISITWWTNIRFEKSFTKDLCRLLSESGCVAVSGGLEVASDRLLKLIDKGVTVEQVAKVNQNFTESGIMVHAYLMFGYPTQTVQETVDSLEMVRQMFELGVLQSGFWHQFAMTAHAPVGLEPEKFSVVRDSDIVGSFANNDLVYTDKTGIDHGKFGFGLKKSLFNFMHGVCFDFPLQDWFEFKIPRTTIPYDFIANALENNSDSEAKPSSKVIYIGTKPIVKHFTKTKKGQSFEMVEMTFHSKSDMLDIEFSRPESEWLVNILTKVSANQQQTFTFQKLKLDFEENFEHFELFWQSRPVKKLRDFGLLVL